jgi:hypothetical protein
MFFSVLRYLVECPVVECQNVLRQSAKQKNVKQKMSNDKMSNSAPLKVNNLSRRPFVVIQCVVRHFGIRQLDIRHRNIAPFFSQPVRGPKKIIPSLKLCSTAVVLGFW